MNLQEALANLTGVTARLEALTEARATAETALAASNIRIAELEASIASLPSVEALKAAEDLAAQEKVRADAAEAKQADFDQKVAEAANKKAAEAIAASGHDPVAVAQSHEAGSKVISRSDFDAMSQGERGKFLASGGKIKP